MLGILEFLEWSFILYWIHRAAHIIPWMQYYHWNHHSYINNNITGWKFNNLFLFNDNWNSTADLWITEVIPTIVIAWVLDAWWLVAFYYVWAAVLQETLEHSRLINWYPLTCGQWHMVHHKNPNKNFGLFFPIWDKIFKTESWTTLD